MQDVRDDVPDCTVFALVGGKIGEPFCKEAFCVKIQARRTDEHLRIACPAKALVALRAVGRHIEEIALLPPDYVFKQLVQKRIGADIRYASCRSGQRLP